MVGAVIQSTGMVVSKDESYKSDKKAGSNKTQLAGIISIFFLASMLTYQRHKSTQLDISDISSKVEWFVIW